MTTVSNTQFADSVGRTPWAARRGEYLVTWQGGHSFQVWRPEPDGWTSVCVYHVGPYDRPLFSHEVHHALHDYDITSLIDE